jgi:hypothetical protein
MIKGRVQIALLLALCGTPPGPVIDVTDPPVVQVPLQHRLGVTRQHLGLHLLAIIIF